MFRLNAKPARTVLFSTLTPARLPRKAALYVLDRVTIAPSRLRPLNHHLRTITHTAPTHHLDPSTPTPAPEAAPPSEATPRPPYSEATPSKLNTPSTIISTPAALSSLLTTFSSLLPPLLSHPSSPSRRPRLYHPLSPSRPTHLYLDLEGTNLSRHGTIALLTLYIPALDHAYLVDVHTLGALAFSTPCPLSGTTLSDVLASPDIPKVFFDVRNDSDALFAHYGVRLEGVEDVQLMECAVRVERRKLKGLAGCVGMYLGGNEGLLEGAKGGKGGKGATGPGAPALLSEAELGAWRAAKEEGSGLYMPERGGGYEVFEERPMRRVVERYCVNDVVLLPLLRTVFLKRLSSRWKQRVVRETKKRVENSQKEGYNPNEKKKGLGPWGPGKYD